MESYRINGKTYDESALKSWAADHLKNNATEEWLKEIAGFIHAWFDDSVTINLHTSGTTGTSKSYTIPKVSMIQSARLTCKFFNLNSTKNALLCLPAKYIGGKMMIVRSFISGMNLIIQEPTSSPLGQVKDQSIDFCPMIPLQVQNSLRDFEDVYNNIENVIIGGAPVSSQLEKKIMELTSNSYATFGMTETLSHIALRKISGADKSEHFEALSGIRFELNEDCLVIEAPHLFSGKLKTNDIVELLDPTSFVWKGRKDLIINSGGIKINPEEIERQIAAFIEVDFFISAIEDETLGQKVILVLEDPNQIMDSDSILHLLKLNLKSHTAPKEIYFSKEFTRTPTGKIKRKETATSVGITVV